MNLTDIALSNLKRRKGKTFFLLFGLALGVATMVALVGLSEALTEEFQHKLEKYGANIIVTPKSEHLGLSYEGLSLGDFSFETNELREADLAAIKTIKNAANVAAVGPMVLGPVKVGERNVLLAGVDFKVMARLKPWWRLDGERPAPGQVILGARTAQVLGLASGREIEIGAKTYSISGVLELSGSQDDDLIFTGLGEAQEILNKPGLVSMVEVAALCTACPIEEMVRQISEVLPGASVTAISSVVEGRMETLKLFRKFSLGGSFLIVLVSGLVVLVTMMGSVKERTVEIGTFLSVGFRRGHVLRIVLTESLILSAAAGLLGWLVGTAVSEATLPQLADMSHFGMTVQPWLALAALALSLVVGLVASAYPAVMAARLDPYDALRRF